MDPEQPQPEVLLVHDGDLDEVHDLLCELAVACSELRREAYSPEVGTGWRVVIASARRMLELELAPGESPDRRPTTMSKPVPYTTLWSPGSTWKVTPAYGG